MNYLISNPQAVKDKYEPNSSVDFLLDFAGMTILTNSVSIRGKLNCVKDVGNPNANPVVAPTVVTDTDVIYMDPLTGIDACFQSVNTSFSGNSVESITDYPRIRKMMLSSSLSRNDAVQNASNIAALRLNDEEQTLMNLVKATDFSVKLSNCLNENLGLPYSKTGQIKLTLNLASVYNVLYGTGVDLNTTYWLSDLQLHYMATQEPKKVPPVEMIVKHTLKQSIESGNSNVTFFVPQPSDKISCSLIQTSRITTNTTNSLVLEKPDTVSRVRLQVNDGVSGIVNYSLESESEILEHYLRSMGSNKHNQVTVQNMLLKREFGIGYSYTKSVANSKISLQLESSIATQYNLYAYFNNLTTM